MSSGSESDSNKDLDLDQLRQLALSSLSQQDHHSDDQSNDNKNEGEEKELKNSDDSDSTTITHNDEAEINNSHSSSSQSSNLSNRQESANNSISLEEGEEEEERQDNRAEEDKSKEIIQEESKVNTNETNNFQTIEEIEDGTSKHDPSTEMGEDTQENNQISNSNIGNESISESVNITKEDEQEKDSNPASLTKEETHGTLSSLKKSTVNNSEDEGEDMDLGEDDEVSRATSTKPITTTNTDSKNEVNTVSEKKTSTKANKFSDLSSLSSDSSDSTDIETATPSQNKPQKRSQENSDKTSSSKHKEAKSDSGDEFDALLRRHTARQQKTSEEPNQKYRDSSPHSSSSTSPAPRSEPRAAKTRRRKHPRRGGGRGSRGRRGGRGRRQIEHRNHRQYAAAKPTPPPPPPLPSSSSLTSNFALPSKDQPTPSLGGVGVADMDTTRSESSTPINFQQENISQRQNQHQYQYQHRHSSTLPSSRTASSTSDFNRGMVQPANQTSAPQQASQFNQPPPPPPPSTAYLNKQHKQRQNIYELQHQHKRQPAAPPPPPSPPPSSPHLPHPTPQLQGGGKQYPQSQSQSQSQSSSAQQHCYSHSQSQHSQAPSIPPHHHRPQHLYQYPSQSQQPTYRPQQQQQQQPPPPPVQFNHSLSHQHQQKQQNHQHQPPMPEGHSSHSYQQQQYLFHTPNTVPSESATPPLNVSLSSSTQGGNHQRQHQSYIQRPWQPPPYTNAYPQTYYQPDPMPSQHPPPPSSEQQPKPIGDPSPQFQGRGNVSHPHSHPPPISYSGHREQPPWKQTSMEYQQPQPQQREESQPSQQKEAQPKQNRPSNTTNHNRVVLSFDSSEESDTESSTDAVPHSPNSKTTAPSASSISAGNDNELERLKKKLAEKEREKAMIVRARQGQAPEPSQHTGKRDTPDTNQSLDAETRDRSARPRKRRRLSSENIEDEIDSAQNMLSAKEDRLRRAQDRLKEAERKVFENQEQLRQSRGKKREIGSQMRKLEQQLSILRSVFAECEADEEDCQARVESAEKQREASQRMADNLETDIDRLNLRVYEMNLHLSLSEGRSFNALSRSSIDSYDSSPSFGSSPHQTSNANFRQEAPPLSKAGGGASPSESSSSESEDLEALRQQAMASVKQSRTAWQPQETSKPQEETKSNQVENTTEPQSQKKIQDQPRRKSKPGHAKYKHQQLNTGPHSKSINKQKSFLSHRPKYSKTSSSTFHRQSIPNHPSSTVTSTKRKPSKTLASVHKTLINAPKESAEKDNRRVMAAFEKALAETKDESCSEGLFFMNTAGDFTQFASLVHGYSRHTLAAILGYTNEPSPHSHPLAGDGDNGSSSLNIHHMNYKTASISSTNRFSDKKHIDNEYQSPLFCLRSYRLSPLFIQEWERSPASKTFSNKINPFSLFCRFELHGQCNDDECRWQHQRNYSMSDQELVEDLVSYLPNNSPRPNQLIKQTLQDLKTKDKNDALVPLLKHVRSVATNSIQKQNTSNENTETEGDADYPSLFADILRRSSSQQPTDALIRKTSDTNKGQGSIPSLNQPDFIDHTHASSSALSTDPRYFEENGAISNDQYEKTLAGSPNDIWKWMEYSLEVITRQKGGGVNMPSDVTSSRLKRGLSILARGLEQNPNSESLWLVYMELFFMYPDIADAEERRKLFQHAVKFLPGSYLLWHAFLHSEIDLDSKCNCIDDALKSFSDSELDDKSKSRFIGAMILEKANLFASSGHLDNAIQYLENMIQDSDNGDNESNINSISSKEDKGKDPKMNKMGQLLEPEHRANLWTIRISVQVMKSFPFVTHGRRISFLKEMETPLGIQYSHANAEHVSSVHSSSQTLFETAIASVSDSWNAQLPLILNYVHLELYLNNYDSARDICQRFIRQQPYCLDLWILYAQFEDAESSRTIYSRALEYFPDSTILLYFYALFLNRNDGQQSACKILCNYIVRHAKGTENDENNLSQARTLFRLALGLPTEHEDSCDVEAYSEARHNVYLWLCYIMLELLGRNFDACEQAFQTAFQEFSQYNASRQMLWWEYLMFLKMCRRKDSSLLGRAVNNCLTDARVFLKNHPQPDSPDIQAILQLLSHFEDYPFVMHLAKVYAAFDYRFHNSIIRNIYLSTLTPRTASLSIENYCHLFPDNYLFHLSWIDHEVLVMKRVARALRISKSLYRKFPTLFPVWDKLLALISTQGASEQVQELFNAGKPTFRYLNLFWQRYLDFVRNNQLNTVKLVEIKNQINEAGVKLPQ